METLMGGDLLRMGPFVYMWGDRLHMGGVGVQTAVCKGVVTIDAT